MSQGLAICKLIDFGQKTRNETQLIVRQTSNEKWICEVKVNDNIIATSKGKNKKEAKNGACAAAVEVLK